MLQNYVKYCMLSFVVLFLLVFIKIKTLSGDRFCSGHWVRHAMRPNKYALVLSRLFTTPITRCLDMQVSAGEVDY